MVQQKKPYKRPLENQAKWWVDEVVEYHRIGILEVGLLT
jgi:hypothetical protein